MKITNRGQVLMLILPLMVVGLVGVGYLSQMVDQNGNLVTLIENRHEVERRGLEFAALLSNPVACPNTLGGMVVGGPSVPVPALKNSISQDIYGTGQTRNRITTGTMELMDDSGGDPILATLRVKLDAGGTQQYTKDINVRVALDAGNHITGCQSQSTSEPWVKKPGPNPDAYYYVAATDIRVGIGTTIVRDTFNIVDPNPSITMSIEPATGEGYLKLDTQGGGTAYFGDANMRTWTFVARSVGYKFPTEAENLYFGDFNYGGPTWWEALIFNKAGNVGFAKTWDLTYKANVQGLARSTATQVNPSDRRFKDNIQSLNRSLEKVRALNGVEFSWRKSGAQDMGVIAQDVEPQFPSMVATDPKTGIKSVNYPKLAAPLIESVKTLDDGFLAAGHDLDVISLQLSALDRDSIYIKKEIARLKGQLVH